MMHAALKSAQAFPVTEVPRLGGGTIQLGAPGWQAIFVYRGLHCPICKAYLAELETKLPELAGIGIDVVIVSGDPEEKAQAMVDEVGLTVATGYGLSVPQMQALGLYISDPRSPQETDRPFPEPGFFLVNPQGNLHMVDISNAPFLRPDLAKLPARIKFVLEKEYPIRGTHTG